MLFFTVIFPCTSHFRFQLAGQIMPFKGSRSLMETTQNCFSILLITWFAWFNLPHSRCLTMQTKLCWSLTTAHMSKLHLHLPLKNKKTKTWWIYIFPLLENTKLARRQAGDLSRLYKPPHPTSPSPSPNQIKLTAEIDGKSLFIKVLYLRTIIMCIALLKKFLLYFLLTITIWILKLDSTDPWGDFIGYPPIHGIISLTFKSCSIKVKCTIISV